MPYRRTLIATAVTACTIAGALIFASPGGIGSPPPSDATPTEALDTPDTPGSTTTAPVARFGATTAPAQAAPPVEVPAAAEPLDVSLAPADAGTVIVTGSEAVTWLDEAPASVAVDVAANLDTTPDELRERFVEDPSAFLSADGMAGYIEPVPDDVPTDASADTPVEPPLVEADGSTPIDVFALHSLPSSTKVVYLDFDGHQMENEYWNSAYSVGPFTNLPYDIDGDPSTFSDTERARILEIWQYVADDYAPFDIDVTTQDPGIDGLRKSNSGDTTFGTRTVITSSDWFAPANDGRRIGGIALLNVFTSSTDHASYVFSSNLSGGRAKYVADAASHEAGHTFSLSHDGTASASYYGGHGTWGPIMGTPYSRSVTQWSNGQYPGANNTEDDLDKIGARGGLRTDDHANTAGGATAVSAGTHAGLIGVGGDVDTFRVTPAGGDTRITVAAPAPATNLLARVTVRGSGGNVVAEIDPSVAAGWSLSTVVPASAGTFTVEVAGTSWLAADTGFVTYGSVGAYSLTVADLPASGTTTSSTSTTSTTAPPTSSTSTSTSTSTTSTDLDHHDVDEHVDEHHRAPNHHLDRTADDRAAGHLSPDDASHDPAGGDTSAWRVAADGDRSATAARHSFGVGRFDSARRRKRGAGPDRRTSRRRR